MTELITVPFHNDTLFAVSDEGVPLVAIKPIAVRLGLDWSAQFRRIQRDTILSEGIAIMAIPSAAGGPQETTCLRLDLVNGWLFGIDENRARAEIRDTVLLYKRECYRVLFEHFYAKAAQQAEGGRDAAPETESPDTAENDNLKLRKVTVVRDIFGNRSARQMYIKLGLETVPAMFDALRQGDMFELGEPGNSNAAPDPKAA